VSTVGMVGLGQMGAAMAASLVDAGFEVIGTDLVADRRRAAEATGVRTVDSASQVAAAAARVVTSLPSAAALDAVVDGDDGLLAAGRDGLLVIETSTLPLDVKERNRTRADARGAILLDCPLSGTGAQARTKDLVVYASGDPAAVDSCSEVFDGFARQHFTLGAFGNGSRMKYLANLLVTIHNVAAAEAMVLGRKAGLDPYQILEVIGSGAGTSRMFEVRGPAMAAGDYDTPGISAEVYLKDVRIIAEFARSLQVPLPLFAQSAEVHVAAVAQGHGQHDTASVCAVLEQLAGIER
jgi:L-threonate 2-dehydrogenase